MRSFRKYLNILNEHWKNTLLSPMNFSCLLIEMYGQINQTAGVTSSIVLSRICKYNCAQIHIIPYAKLYLITYVVAT